ncbi:PEP-CTERM sorting domain-containing protein [Luteolibacter algae]|uniref:PEP-CTERM sorting domain-containing protein n=1 Tax=Luteolibacter algae TaxID=454151 RepID=A0ABW5D5T4_9BACT
MKRLLITLAATTAFTASSQAALIAFGDFSGDARFANGNSLAFSSANQGWEAKNFTWGSGSSTTQTFSNEQATVGSNYGRGVASAFSPIAGQTGTDNFQLSFDWTAPDSAVGDSLSVTYQILGFKINEGATPDAADKFFNAINGRDYKPGNLGGLATWTNLLDGSSGSNTSATAFGTFTGTAGVLGTAAIDLNLGGVNMEDFDYIAVKFNAGVDGSEVVSGGILDNVAINVPEPSVAVLSALGALGLIRRRRR